MAWCDRAAYPGLLQDDARSACCDIILLSFFAFCTLFCKKLNKTDKNPVPWDLLGISLAFSSEMGYTSSRRAMQSKFMCVKCLSDGELPKDEKRNLAVRELLLAATEDK